MIEIQEKKDADAVSRTPRSATSRQLLPQTGRQLLPQTARLQAWGVPTPKTMHETNFSDVFRKQEHFMQALRYGPSMRLTTAG